MAASGVAPTGSAERPPPANGDVLANGTSSENSTAEAGKPGSQTKGSDPKENHGQPEQVRELPRPEGAPSSPSDQLYVVGSGSDDEDLGKAPSAKSGSSGPTHSTATTASTHTSSSATTFSKSSGASSGDQLVPPAKVLDAAPAAGDDSTPTVPTIMAPEGAYTLQQVIQFEASAWTGVTPLNRDIPTRLTLLTLPNSASKNAPDSGVPGFLKGAKSPPIWSRARGSEQQRMRRTSSGFMELPFSLPFGLAGGTNGTAAPLQSSSLAASEFQRRPSDPSGLIAANAPVSPGDPGTLSAGANGTTSFSPLATLPPMMIASAPLAVPIAVTIPRAQTAPSGSSGAAVLSTSASSALGGTYTSTSRLGSLFSSANRRHRSKSIVNKSNSTFVAKLTTLDGLPDALREGTQSSAREVVHVVGDPPYPPTAPPHAGPSAATVGGTSSALATAAAISAVAVMPGVGGYGPSMFASGGFGTSIASPASSAARDARPAAADKDAAASATTAAKDANGSAGGAANANGASSSNGSGSSSTLLRMPRKIFSKGSSSKPSATTSAPATLGSDAQTSGTLVAADQGPSVPAIHSWLIMNLGKSLVWMDETDRKFVRALPTCHAINMTTKCTERLDIVIGFSSGDIMWYEAVRHRYNRVNKFGTLINRPVTQVAWVPGSESLFLVAFSDGTVLTIDKDREDRVVDVPRERDKEKEKEKEKDKDKKDSGEKDKEKDKDRDKEKDPDKEKDKDKDNSIKSQDGKEEELVEKRNSNGFLVFKPAKAHKYNPLSIWRLGRFVSGSGKAITDMSFSPNGQYLAVTSLDGCLRIIYYPQERFYGGLQCCTWSPDGTLVVAGGQDDLISVWNFKERQIVARGRGHTSWVSSISFDPWRCDDQAYRFGSVGQDGRLLFWDISAKMAWQLPPKAGLTVSRASPMTGFAGLSGGHGVNDQAPSDVNEHITHSVLPASDVPLIEPSMAEVISTLPCWSLVFSADVILVAEKKGTVQVWQRPVLTSSESDGHETRDLLNDDDDDDDDALLAVGMLWQKQQQMLLGLNSNGGGERSRLTTSELPTSEVSAATSPTLSQPDLLPLSSAPPRGSDPIPIVSKMAAKARALMPSPLIPSGKLANSAATSMAPTVRSGVPASELEFDDLAARVEADLANLSGTSPSSCMAVHHFRLSSD